MLNLIENMWICDDVTKLLYIMMPWFILENQRKFHDKFTITKIHQSS